jgi:hypothetical protein
MHEAQGRKILDAAHVKNSRPHRLLLIAESTYRQAKRSEGQYHLHGHFKKRGSMTALSTLF